MRKLIAAAAIAAAIAAIGAALLAVPQARGTPVAHASGVHCGKPRHASGHLSLDGISRRSGMPVAIILDFAFRCAGYRGGGWGGRMAGYLNRGRLTAPMVRGTEYWILSLP